MGAARADFCADADAVEFVAGIDAGRVPDWRLEHEYHYAVAAVFSADRGLLPEALEADGDRDADLDDAALLDLLFD